MKQALNNLMLIYMKLVTIFRTKSIEPLVLPNYLKFILIMTKVFRVNIVLGQTLWVQPLKYILHKQQ